MVLPPLETSPVLLLRWTNKALQHTTTSLLPATTTGSRTCSTTSISLVDLVKKELERHSLIVLPSLATDTLLLTAKQASLEQQAELDHLVKPRRLLGHSSVEWIMDHFQVAHRQDFCFTGTGTTSSFSSSSHSSSLLDSLKDADGLFTVHERCHLVLGLLEQIYIADNPELVSLLSEQQQVHSQQNNFPFPPKSIFPTSNDVYMDPSSFTTSSSNTSTFTTTTSTPKIPGTPTHLRHLLQSHQWIDVLTPLHVAGEDSLIVGNASSSSLAVALKDRIQRHTWYPLWRMVPPIHEIHAYYGPSIAYYFAFMGFLGSWLRGLGIVGLSSFLFRWYRNDTIDEDEYTPFYGLLCFLWSVLFYRFWERREATLAYQWGTLELASPMDDFEQDFNIEGGLYAHRRPEFQGWKRISPITGHEETYYPRYRRQIHYTISVLVTSCMLAMAFFIMILSLNLQGYIHPPKSNSARRYHPFYVPAFAAMSVEGSWFDAQSSWKCYIPVVLHVVCILTLNTIYRGVARKLTDWENHETATAHDNSLILKRFLFEAFDCYIVLFYLAFYERDVAQLNVELVTVFNIDSFRRLGTEILLPYLLHRFEDASKTAPDTVHPHDLHLDPYEQFDDYMEMMIQFGYVTLFASAYPLASLMMAGAVWLEIRTDMYKLTNLCQKPLAGERIQDIGVWKRILQFMVWFSCLTNCLLFGYTSDQMMHYMPSFYIRDGDGVTHMVHDKGWIAILIIFGVERALILVGLILLAMIPVLPESLIVILKRRKYLLAQQGKKRD